MKNNVHFFGMCTVIIFAMLFTGCMKEETILPESSIEERGVTTPYGITSKATIYGLSTGNQIVHFAAGPPVTVKATVFIRGLQAGERMLAIDIRPSNRLLYGVSNFNLLYSINPSTGLATRISKVSFSPPLSGAVAGIDFNPRYDRLRIVTDTDQNLYINPANGTVVSVDVPLSPAGVGVNSIAYTTATIEEASLYDISVRDGFVYRQLSGKGALSRIGTTGLGIDGEGGFDISRDNTNALAVLNAFSTEVAPGTIGTPGVDDLSQKSYRLYSIDLTTGKATSLGRINPMIGIAIP
jgi:hypothetical protein